MTERSSKKPFTVADLYLHHKVLESQCDPAGSFAVCTVESIDRDDDGYLSRLWLFPLDGSPGRQLTRGPGRDSTPKLSPSGRRLAFVSTRTGTPQLFLLDLAGGEAQQACTFEGGVVDVEWSPDEKYLLATAAVKVDPELRGGRPAQPPGERKVQVELAWRLPYKTDGAGYQLDREIHLFRIDPGGGRAEQLTDGAFDVYGFCASPDGGRIAYVRTREGRFAHRTDLWLCRAHGGGHREATRDIATVMQPAWSPDGRHIAFAGAAKEGDAQSRLWLHDAGRNEARPLGDESIELASGEPFRWRADGAGLLFVRAHRGRHHVAEIDLRGQVRAVPGPDRQLSAFSAGAGALVYCVDHPSWPSELWTCGLDGSGERKLSHFNAWWEERTPIRAEVRSFEVPDGRGGTETVEGWLLRAEGASGPGPLLNDLHGGPASYALLDFDTNVFWQVLCSSGWSVLALNAVGSASYGPEFCARLAGHWGEYDLPQHLAAIRSLQREGVCDHRIAVSGKSYGGFLSGYAIGNTDLFRAAVVMAPVGNIETHYGTSDGGYYADPLYMGTAPAFDRKLARQLSPMRHVEEARTPTLFMQGSQDERCPKCQSEELFVSLYRTGRASTELVLYPDENHAFLGHGKPSCREDAARRIIDWIRRHAEGSAAS